MIVSSIFEKCQSDRLSDGQDVRVLVTGRGGRQVISELQPVSGSFERLIDNTSKSSVQVQSFGSSCCKELSSLRTMDNELVWIRDGCIAWRGPLTFIRFLPNGIVELEAMDLTYWWAVRRIGSQSHVGVDASFVVRDYHEAAMEPDPIENFNLSLQVANQKVNLTVTRSDHRYAFDAINSLADYAVDYTAYGDQVLVGGADLFPVFPIELNDDHWTTPPPIEMRGPAQRFSTRVVAIGTNGLEIEVDADRDIQDFYGIIERVEEFQGISNIEDLEKAARSFLDIYSQPYYLNSQSEAILRFNSPISFKALIPGVRVNLVSQATCKPIRGQFRIAKVTHNLNGTVGVLFEPVGTTESDV